MPARSPSDHAPLRRAGRGARVALTWLLPYVGLIVLILLVKGPELVTRRGHHFRVDLLAATYALGALALGAIVGLWPWFRTAPGAVLGGWLAMLPMVAGIALATDHGYLDWTPRHTLLTVVTSVLLGTGVGLGMRRAGVRRAWRQGAARVTSRVHPPGR